MKPRLRLSAVLLIALAATAAPLPLAAQELQPFQASFAVTWNGMNAGTATLALKRTSGDTWFYESRNHARGIFRIALPGEILQASTLRVTPEGVQPLHFRGDDGTSKTAKDVDIRFDWAQRRATGVAEEQKVDIALEDGVQDGMSIQIALMTELAKGHTPTGFRMLDKRVIKDYEYSRQGEADLDTAIGSLKTVIYRSKRPDSRYSTWYWVAPDHGYLPVKVERHKVDEVQWSMAVQKLERG